MIKTFQDFRNEISIVEMALANGYKIDRRAGNKWPVLKDDITGDKIIIVKPNDPGNQGYFNPHDDQNDKGTLINFVKNRLGSIFPYDGSKSEIQNVNTVLYNFLRLPVPERSIYRQDFDKLKEEFTSHKFSLPDSITPLKNAEYLHYRGISPEVINGPEFQAKIYNVENNGFTNIGFPYFDRIGDTVGFEVRNKGFKHVIAGSQRDVSVWHSNIPETLDKVILAESPIDALSYHQLKGEKNSLYVSFGGAVSMGQLEAVKAITEKANRSDSFRYISAVDNDDMGHRYTEKMQQVLSPVIADYPIANDYNNDLVNASKRSGGFKR